MKRISQPASALRASHTWIILQIHQESLKFPLERAGLKRAKLWSHFWNMYEYGYI